jgi:hypothetical protein
MKISKAKFVFLFLVSAFVFQFVSNSLLGSEVRLFPARDESFLGTGSPVAWKRSASTVLLPVKLVLMGPLLPLTEMPDLPPPFLVAGFAAYWTVLALLVHYLVGRFKRS